MDLTLEVLESFIEPRFRSITKFDNLLEKNLEHSKKLLLYLDIIKLIHVYNKDNGQ